MDGGDADGDEDDDGDSDSGRIGNSDDNGQQWLRRQRQQRDNGSASLRAIQARQERPAVVKASALEAQPCESEGELKGHKRTQELRVVRVQTCAPCHLKQGHVFLASGYMSAVCRQSSAGRA